MLENEQPKRGARDALLCLAVLVLVTLIVGLLFRKLAQDSQSANTWLQTPVASCARKYLQAIIWLLIALFFGSYHSSAVERLGLNGSPTLFGWSMAWVAIGICFLGYYSVSTGWMLPNARYYEFHDAGGLVWFLYVIYASLFVPFYEELLMRGYVYRGLRENFGPWLSTSVVLCANVYFHWGLLSGRDSIHTAVLITVLAGLLCFIRERSKSLWNCVLFHAAYNATATLDWRVYLIASIFLLPICIRGSGTVLKLKS